MGEFIEFIFGNLFFIVIVIAGLISALSKNKETQKRSQQRPQRRVPQNNAPSRTQTSAPERNRRPVREQQVQTTKSEGLGGRVSTSIEAEQRAQMEDLESRYGVTTKDLSSRDFSEHQFESADTLKALDILSNEQEELKDNLRGNLRKKGFINGIIMAEVLGKPRSLKQYRSPTLERYEK